MSYWIETQDTKKRYLKEVKIIDRHKLVWFADNEGERINFDSATEAEYLLGYLNSLSMMEAYKPIQVATDNPLAIDSMRAKIDRWATVQKNITESCDLEELASLYYIYPLTGCGEWQEYADAELVRLQRERYEQLNFLKVQADARKHYDDSDFTLVGEEQ